MNPFVRRRLTCQGCVVRARNSWWHTAVFRRGDFGADLGRSPHGSRRCARLPPAVCRMTLRAFRLGKPHPNPSPLTPPVARLRIREVSTSSRNSAETADDPRGPRPLGRNRHARPALPLAGVPFRELVARRLEHAPWSDRSAWIRLAPFSPCDVNGWLVGKSDQTHSATHLVTW
jgi:hypothetical protein